MTQPRDPISCHGKSAERTKEIISKPISLFRSTAFPRQSDRTTESESGIGPPDWVVQCRSYESLRLSCRVVDSSESLRLTCRAVDSFESLSLTCRVEDRLRVLQTSRWFVWESQIDISGRWFVLVSQIDLSSRRSSKSLSWGKGAKEL